MYPLLLFYRCRLPEKNDSEETEAPENAYLRVDDSPILYEISGTVYEDLMKYTYDDLRHTEVLPASLDEVNQIEISLEGNQYSITSEKKNKEQIYKYDGEEIASDKLVSALQSLQANEFTEEEPADQEEIGLTLHLNWDGDPVVQISLYRYDGTNCLMVEDGSPVAFVSRSLVVDLMEAVHEIVLK